jgi:hypothetical protein
MSGIVAGGCELPDVVVGCDRIVFGGEALPGFFETRRSELLE